MLRRVSPMANRFSPMKELVTSGLPYVLAPTHKKACHSEIIRRHLLHIYIINSMNMFVRVICIIIIIYRTGTVNIVEMY